MESSLPVNFSDLKIKALRMGDESGNKVFEVVDGITDTIYALKEFSSHYDINDRAKIFREFQTLKKLNHPNLVKCHEIFDIDGRIYLLVEHMDGGSLAGVDITSVDSLANVAHQVLLGLSYLHGNNISHGDIKPSNVFVNSTKQVKVLYLGKILSNAQITWSGNKIKWIHDEFSWDVWNVGLFILKLYKGSSWGYKDSDFEEVMDSSEVFSSSHYVGPPMQKSPMELWRFLLCCMQTDFSKRWRVETLVRHPFVKDLSVSVPKPQDFAASVFNRRMELVRPALAQELSGSIPKKKRTFSVVAKAVAASVAFRSTIRSDKRGGEYIHRNKKPKISTEDSMYDSEHSKDPAPTLPSVDFGLHNMPDYVGRCIQHCILFLPDFEFEKDKLVQMWIAEECIEADVTRRAEELASSCFDALIREEIIIPSKYDNLYRQMKYKVNAFKISTWFPKQGEYSRIDIGDLSEISREVLHLTLPCNRLDRSLFDDLRKFKQLRTLVLIGNSSALIKKLPNDIFLGLKLLRTLDLSHTHVSELPGSIGKLESLHFLDMSGTPINQLHESTDRLYSMQTLKLKGCFKLSALPRGFSRLTNLRHLDLHIVGQLKSMPKGMGNLTKLQTLHAFLVGKNEDGCGIGELKNMNDITGSFCISRLEKVSNIEEAKEAALADKQHIVKLELRWGADHANNNNSEEILECLQPHFHLKELEITFYSGLKLPSWISNPAFTDLASITLYKCVNCHVLPTIGELPSLKTLHIVEMKNLRDINMKNRGFFNFNAFPRLEKLTLENMFSLEELSGIEDGDFPCIRHISLRYCPKLCVLPSLSSLRSLEYLELNHCTQLISLPEGLLPDSLESLIIRDCPELNERCIKDGGQDWFKISSVKDIWLDLQKVSLD